MGGLHPIETVLVLLLLAFGPFLIIGVVVLLRRRRESSQPPEAYDGPGEAANLPDAARR